MKIKEFRALASPSGFDSGGGIRAVKLTLCAALLAADRRSATRSADWTNRPPSRASGEEAGSGASGFNGDGIPAVQAQLDLNPAGCGNGQRRQPLHRRYGSNRRIRKVYSWGNITTITGTGSGGPYGGDGGPAVDAQISRAPWAWRWTAPATSTSPIRIEPPDPQGGRHGDRSPPFAGCSDYGGNGRDGGSATEAWLDEPSGVAADGAGNLYIADTDNHRIRKVDSSGTITTIAGTGEVGVRRWTAARRSMPSWATPVAWRWTVWATATSVGAARSAR